MRNSFSILALNKNVWLQEDVLWGNEDGTAAAELSQQRMQHDDEFSEMLEPPTKVF